MQLGTSHSILTIPLFLSLVIFHLEADPLHRVGHVVVLLVHAQNREVRAQTNKDLLNVETRGPLTPRDQGTGRLGIRLSKCF